MTQAFFLLAAYLLGSISFGILMSKVFGLADPRTVGSGNPGATNILRSGKKAAAALTLLGDAAKGWLAVWLAMRYNLAPLWVDAVAAAVFLGHLYPLYHGFKGGKGVATLLGILLAFSPMLGLGALVVWIVVFAIWRISSVAALVASSTSPFISATLFGWTVHTPTILVLTVILIWRHKTNIQKLLAGNEAGFGKK